MIHIIVPYLQGNLQSEEFEYRAGEVDNNQGG